MKPLRKIYRQVTSTVRAIRGRWYRVRAGFVASMHGGTLDWPASATAAVPVRCDGRGSVEIGAKVKLGYRAAPRLGDGEILLQARGKGSRIRIGPGCVTSNNLAIISMMEVEIGERSLIGDQVSIYDSDFHRIDPATRHEGSDEPRPVRLGSNVWLGSRVMVLKGVTIGENTVVAAGSIVTSSLPANVIAAGVPARVVREIETP